MARIKLDARHVLVGDSFWLFSAVRHYADQGNEVTVVCRTDNKSVFEFMRDYCVGCESVETTLDPGSEVLVKHDGGPCPNVWKVNDAAALDVELPLRRPLEPISGDDRPYICFQPESAAHQKRSNDLKGLVCVGKGYSVGVQGEYVVPGSEAFHSKPIAEVARLIYHSVGMVAVFSSMSLFASLLGKKVMSPGYEGLQLTDGMTPTGFPTSRCKFTGGQHLPTLIRDYIGPGFVQM